MLVGGVALINSTAPHLHRAEDDGVTQNLSAGVGRRTWSQEEEVGWEKEKDKITRKSLKPQWNNRHLYLLPCDGNKS